MDMDFKRCVIAWHIQLSIGARNRGRTGTLHFWKAADFKSDVSTNFTIRAERPIVKQNSPGNAVDGAENWRRDPESNRATRICNPLHNRFAIAPKGIQKKEAKLPFDAAAGLVTGCEFWSGKSDLH